MRTILWCSACPSAEAGVGHRWSARWRDGFAVRVSEDALCLASHLLLGSPGWSPSRLSPLTLWLTAHPLVRVEVPWLLGTQQWTWSLHFLGTQATSSLSTWV